MKNNFRWKRTKHAAFLMSMRIILGLVICAAAISTIYLGRKYYGEDLKEGDVSLRTIYAPIDFKYRIGIDEEKTESERKKAREAQEDIYDIDSKIDQELFDRVDKFFVQLISLQTLPEAEKETKLEEVKTVSGVDLANADVRVFLAEPRLEQVKTSLKDLLKELLVNGLIDDSLQKNLVRSKRKNIILQNLEKKAQVKVPIENLLTVEWAKKEISSKAQTIFPENRKLRLAAINLTNAVIKSNIRFNEVLTGKTRQLAYDETPIQYKEREVKKEELIISRGERVNKEHILKIKEMFQLRISVNRLMFLSGAAILTLIFLGMIGLYLKFYEPKIFYSTRKLTLIGVLFILILALAKIITYSPLPSYTIPVAIASILIAILIGPRTAIIITVTLSIFVGIIAGDKLNVACVSFVGGMVGIFFIYGARRRSQILIAGCLVGMANFISICAIELLYGLKYTVFLKGGFWGIINGLGSAIIITGVLPVFEYVFNLVTNISLLELSDLNHPLLKEMVLKAPGTYHHSLIVGNLAEAASEAIGANALLARVGSYFHDIGKTEKAEYFSENQVGTAKKKHDKLTPSMSSLIITNHVKDGVELARKYKLNQAIIDFMEQHHGTSLIYYFYQRALEKVEDDQLPKEEGYRYPGPKPQSKEAAVVLLADSVEAASRTLNEPTPARIRGLVRKIINNKFIDNQLDQCELTLKDLDIIAETFTRILMGIFHSRIEYEEASDKTKADNKNKKQPEKADD